MERGRVGATGEAVGVIEDDAVGPETVMSSPASASWHVARRAVDHRDLDGPFGQLLPPAWHEAGTYQRAFADPSGADQQVTAVVLVLSTSTASSSSRPKNSVASSSPKGCSPG